MRGLARGERCARVADQCRVERRGRPLLQRLDPVGVERQTGHRLDHEAHHRSDRILVVATIQRAAEIAVTFLPDRLEAQAPGQHHAIVKEAEGVGRKGAHQAAVGDRIGIFEIATCKGCRLRRYLHGVVEVGGECRVEIVGGAIFLPDHVAAEIDLLRDRAAQQHAQARFYRLIARLERDVGVEPAGRVAGRRVGHIDSAIDAFLVALTRAGLGVEHGVGCEIVFEGQRAEQLVELGVGVVLRVVGVGFGHGRDRGAGNRDLGPQVVDPDALIGEVERGAQIAAVIIEAGTDHLRAPVLSIDGGLAIAIGSVHAHPELVRIPEAASDIDAATETRGFAETGGDARKITLGALEAQVDAAADARAPRPRRAVPARLAGAG